MTNDIFGHNAGDRLIKKCSEILKQSCSEKDFVARVGGDEFIIIMPGASADDAQEVISKIRSGFEHTYIEAVKCSSSLGSDTKTSVDQPLEVIIANAECSMYNDKMINRRSVHSDIIDTIINTLHMRNPREKQHSELVSELCARLGYALNLPEAEINKLKRAGYLHDIGKITINDNILRKNNHTEEELKLIQQHSVVGYRILNLFDNTLDLAEYVYGHHERWSGGGYPRGLKGEQIPLISRIISIAENYERWSNTGMCSDNEKKRHWKRSEQKKERSSTPKFLKYSLSLWV